MENEENSEINAINNNNNEGISTYNGSVNVQPFVNVTPMLYQNPNYYYPYAYVVPPIGTSSQYTIPLNANQPYIHPMTQQPSLVPGTPSNASVPTSSYVISSTIQQPPASSSSTNQQPPVKASNQQQNGSSSEVPQPILYTSNPSQNYR